ncbi:MAG: matrixin family metalloprotease [Myxococcota bacterium]|nr:matrixin family metalloprotease [Myxococcota bacterium]
MRARRTLRSRLHALAVRVQMASLVLVVGITTSRTASAFCRTTTCPLPANWNPGVEGSCYPADFEQYCQSLKRPVKPVPLWWRNACVSYDLQQDGTSVFPGKTAAHIVDAAFAKWTSATCGNGGFPSVAAVNLGPVACDQVQYNSGDGNQHVIVFRNPWPHPEDRLNTLGLTTVTFDPDTGELYDADTEINASVSLSVDGSNGNDFESIITHEAGHFLGMAHSVDADATMFAFYASTMRTLHPDDVDGICTIYPPGGGRSVDPSVSPTATIAADGCDPTPRHGFASRCSPNGCTLVSRGAVGVASPGGVVAAGFALLGVASVRRRRQRWTDACRQK